MQLCQKSYPFSAQWCRVERKMTKRRGLFNRPPLSYGRTFTLRITSAVSFHPLRSTSESVICRVVPHWFDTQCETWSWLCRALISFIGNKNDSMFCSSLFYSEPMITVSHHPPSAFPQQQQQQQRRNIINNIWNTDEYCRKFLCW